MVEGERRDLLRLSCSNFRVGKLQATNINHELLHCHHLKVELHVKTMLASPGHTIMTSKLSVKN